LALTLAIGSLLAPKLAAAKDRDPLSAKETDELRDAAQMPEARTKLFLGFARARLEASEKLFPGLNLQQPRPISEARGQLYDFVDIIDQMDDNLDAFSEGGADLRVALRAVIENEGEFQERLQKMRESCPPAVLEQVNGELEDAMEAVNDSADSSRAMLEEQGERKNTAEKPASSEGLLK
jgi:hypothetical protein